MTAPGWPEIVARLHRTLVACDRDTDLELAAGPRRLRVSVRRDTIEGHCPGYDGQQLAELGWRPDGDGGWWFATPRTAEGLHWWSAFAARTAAAVLTADPTALACRVLPPATAADAPATDVTVRDAGPHDVAGPTADAIGPDAETTDAAVPKASTTDVRMPDTAPARPDLGADAAETGPGEPPWREAGPRPPQRVSGRHRAEEQMETPRPRSPEPEPAPADLLARAAARHDLPDYLGVLAAGPVCVPLAGEPSPDRDFPWTVVRGPDRAPLLPVFTSADTLTAFAGDGVPFVALSAAELLADWPDPAWGLAVDPGAPHGLTLAPPALAALLAANDVTGPGSSDVETPEPVTAPERDTGGR
ncbi:SseB family protein [Micromonospora sp. NPDC050200]|uniref:SseB family protein n=1 Tax=Micromonospora sp. NPDC050200 TaxID=3155664 RepID=UPI003401A5BA